MAASQKGDGLIVMPYVVTSACIGSKDESCIEVCPVDCIHDIGEMVAVHPDECIECGACQPECPVGAIVPDGDLAAPDATFAEVNAALREGPAAAARALEAELARRQLL